MGMIRRKVWFLLLFAFVMVGFDDQYPLPHKKDTNFFLSNREAKITAHLDVLSPLFTLKYFHIRTSKPHIPHKPNALIALD